MNHVASCSSHPPHSTYLTHHLTHRPTHSLSLPLATVSEYTCSAHFTDFVLATLPTLLPYLLLSLLCYRTCYSPYFATVLATFPTLLLYLILYLILCLLLCLQTKGAAPLPVASSSSDGGAPNRVVSNGTVYIQSSGEHQ